MGITRYVCRRTILRLRGCVQRAPWCPFRLIPAAVKLAANSAGSSALGCGFIDPDSWPVFQPPISPTNPPPLHFLRFFLSPLVFAQGTLTVVGEGETMVRASMDAECNASMDAHAPLGMPGLAGKLTVHQGKNDLIQGTAFYDGESKVLLCTDKDWVTMLGRKVWPT